MPPSDDWSFSPPRVRLRKGTKELLQLTFGSAGQKQLLEEGLFWVLPIARRDKSTSYGVRLCPGLALAESPIVWFCRGQATTLATRARDCLPTLVLHAVALQSRGRWKALREHWILVEPELLDIEAAMGARGGVARLATVLQDARLEGLFEKDVAASMFPFTALREVLPAVDPSPDLAAALEYAASVPSESRLYRPPPEVHEPWRRTVLVIAGRAAAFSKPAAREDQCRWCWELAQGPASLDAGAQAFPIHAFVPFRDGKSCPPRTAAMILSCRPELPVGCQDHILWKPTLAAATGGREYAGKAHVEAAGALEERGEPVAAWSALQTAAFWSYWTEGKANPAIRDAARALARRQGWEEIASVMDAMK